MAFIPDDALRRKRRDKLTPAAWDVYEAHCMARNHRTGLSGASKERVSDEMGIALKTVWNATTELRQKGWIREEAAGVRLLVGDFSPVDKRHAPAPEIPDLGNGVPGLGNPIPEIGNEIPQSGKEIPDLGNGAYIGTGARPNQPINQPKKPANTHAPRPTKLPDLSPEREAEVAELHAHYCARVKPAELSPAVSKTLNRAIGEKGLAFCKRVVDGCALDDWKDRPLNNSLDFIFETPKRMERLAEIERLKRGQAPNVAAAPAQPSKPALSEDDLNSFIRTCSDMLRDGRTPQELSKQFADAMPQAQWARVLSVAQAQARVPKARAAPEPSPPAAASGNVVEFGPRVSR